MLCGGQSTEHEISVCSAKNIIAALDKNKYDISVVYITQHGQWWLLSSTQDFINTELQALLTTGQAEPITVVLGDSKQPWQSLNDPKRRYGAECVFPILHGTNGEDGTLQGLLDFLHLPYVGADVLSSAICMEKDIAKQRLRAAGIPTIDWHTIQPHDSRTGLYEKLVAKFGKTLFVKPTSLGSSVAAAQVRNQAEFDKAVQVAFQYDKRVMIEPCVVGREIECSVLGNDDPDASQPGEIITHHDFYSYDAKYLDPQGAKTEAPAKLPEEVMENIRQVAVDSFKVMRCTGMARVDFFVVNDSDIYVNELNTLPGFTNISMYPMMWEVSGLAYPELLDKLVELAIERYRSQQSLTRIYHQE